MNGQEPGGTLDVPVLRVPEGRLFGYPTRFVETWAPAVEEVVLRAYQVGGGPCRATVATGETGSVREQVQSRLLGRGSRFRNRTRMALERVRGTVPLDA